MIITLSIVFYFLTSCVVFVYESFSSEEEDYDTALAWLVVLLWPLSIVYDSLSCLFDWLWRFGKYLRRKYK